MKFRGFSNGFCRRPLLAAVLIPLLALPLPAPAGDGTVVAVLRFKQAGANGDTAAASYRAMAAAARKDRLYAKPAQDAPALKYDYQAGNLISAANLARYLAICKSLKCSHLLMGRVITRNKAVSLEAKVFSAGDRAFICTISKPVAGGAMTAAAERVVKMAALYVRGQVPAVSGLSVSRGASLDRVTLTWLCSTPGALFTITRSYRDRGPAMVIGETDETSFADMTAEPGIKYRYTITPVKNGVAGASVSGAGYRKPPNPRGLTVDEMLDPRTRPWPGPGTPEEQEREKLHLQLFDKFYESYFMATFIVMVGKMYINSGDLLAYRDFRNYSWDPGNRTIYFSKPGVLTVKFYSRRFFRFVRDMHLLGIPFDELLPRVIGNGILFCVRSGETEVRESDGRVRYLPNMEAVGMSTEYVRDYEKWKSHSVVFSTSDENLYRKIREAESRGY